LRIGPLILVGGGEPWQQEHCAEIRAQAPVGLMDVAGRTTLREYLHLISRARLVLSVDGSASHLAQAFGRATLTLFGPTVARWWHCPTPQNVRLDGADFAGREAPPTEVIPAASVIQTAIKLWAEAKPS
jgi:heptosyltransferase-2